MPEARDEDRSYLSRQIGTLPLAGVASSGAMDLVRAAAWHNTLLRLGIALPLFAVHDLGAIVAGQGGGPARVLPAPAGGSGDPRRRASYHWLLARLAESDLARAGPAWRLRDDLVAVLLAEILRQLHTRWPERASWVGARPLPLDPGVYLRADLDGLHRAFDMGPAHALIAHLVSNHLFLQTAVERVDLDALRLLGLFHASDAGGVIDLADLAETLRSPAAAGMASFSMDLIPSLLESRRQSGAQTFSIDGYASIERHGSADSVLPSELAYDEDVFLRKVLDGEIFYYGHERQRVDERRLHYLLVDSTASMRGEREVFARGLALALAKRLGAGGGEVWLRFFDSRLYEVLRLSGAGAAAGVAELLAFRSERGRNYGRVFRQLAGELARLRARDTRPIHCYILTHGQCHIGKTLVGEIAEHARLYGVFILPSAELRLDYLPLLQGYQVVTADALADRRQSVARALEIVHDAAAEAGR